MTGGNAKYEFLIRGATGIEANITNTVYILTIYIRTAVFLFFHRKFNTSCFKIFKLAQKVQ